MDSLIKKVDRYANNPEKYSTKKTGEHIPYGYSMSKIWSFDHIENKHAFNWDWESLREHAKNIIDLENRKMLPLTKEELKSH